MTRDRSDRREQARAVLLAAIMVISVFGGTVAFAGSAAAVANGPTLDNSIVQTDSTVTVSATHSTPGNDVTFALDADGDGDVESSQEGSTIKTDTSDSDTGEASAELTVSASLDDGDYTIVAIEEGDPDGSTSLNYGESGTYDISGADSTTLTVDGTPPTVNTASPTDTVSTATPVITVDFEEANSINASTLEVSADNGGTQLFELNEPNAQGVDYNEETQNLTIDIDETKLDRLPEGQINVDVNAEDAAGNEIGGENPYEFSFDVDTNPVDVTITSSYDDVETTAAQPFDVDIGNASAPIDSASVTISSEDGSYEQVLTTEDDVYTAGDGSGDSTFGIESGSEDTDDIPALPDDTITVNATATDADGASNSAETSFEVDTQAPGVENVAIDDDRINLEDSDSVEISVRFNESVQTDSVEGGVYLNSDQSAEVTLGSESDVGPVTSGDAETVTFDVDLSPDSSDASLQALENGSAEVRFSTVTDSTGANTNDSLGASESFAINTTTPTVNIDTGELPTEGDGESERVVLSGVVDLSEAFSASNADGNEFELYVKPGGTDADSDYVPLSDISEEPLDDFNTSTLREGEHELKVNATNNFGNTGEATATIYVDNVDPVIEYVGPELITGDVDVSTLFDVEQEGIESVQYGFATGSVDELSADQITDDDGEFTVDASNDQYTVGVLVDNPGYDGPDAVVVSQQEVDTLTTGEFDIAAEESDNDDGNVTLTVTSPDKLSAFDVSVSDTDDFRTDVSTTVSEDTFEETEDGSYSYTSELDVPRDGQYQFTLDNLTVSDGGQALDPADPIASTSQSVDGSAPNVTDATVVGGDTDRLVVRAAFDEPLNGISSDGVSVEGTDASVTGFTFEEENPETGVVDLEFDSEFQTAEAPDITVETDAVTEAYDENADDIDQTSAPISTVTLDLSSDGDGLNVVSIPAETGRVDISETEFNSNAVDTVSAYDADTGEFDQYSPGAPENSLTNLEGGVGYVVNVEEDTTVEINAENAPAANDRTQQSVEAGWNLVGHYQEGQQQVGQALTPLGDQVYQIEEGYTGTQLTNDAALNPEQGYWLFTNQGGLHVPVNYGGPTSEKPNVFVPSGESFVDTTEPTNTPESQVTLTVAVDTDAAVQTVRADAPDLGIENAELSSAGAPEVQGATAYEGTFDVNYQPGYDGAERSITVGAITTDGNVGSNDVTVDPVDRSGLVEITDADFSDLTEGDTANVTVDVSYNAGGFEDAYLSVKNSSGVEIGSVDGPTTDGSENVNVELSSLDDGEEITAELIDAGEASDYVVANDSESVSGLEDLAYIESSPSTILGTGSTAIQDAANDVASDGATVYVENGTYDSFSLGTGDEIQAAPGVSRNATIENGVEISAVGTNDVRLAGFEITQSQGGNTLEISTGEGQQVQSDLTFEDNTFVVPDTGIGVFAGHIENTDFNGNTFTVADSGTATEMVYIGGEASFGSDGASSNVNLTNNVFEGDVSRESQRDTARAGGNAIEFEATGDSEISGNNFTSISTDEAGPGVKIVYTSSDVTVTAGDNEGLSDGEIHLIDGTITFNDANLENNDEVNVTVTDMEYASTVTVTIENPSGSVVGTSTSITPGAGEQSITLSSPGDVSDSDDLDAILALPAPNELELDTDTTTANKSSSPS